MNPSTKPRSQLIIIDLLLNVAFPVMAGALLYQLPINKKIMSYLPDGLWAYSFTSCILIVWKRKIHIFWMMVVALVFLAFEFLQDQKIIKGTADVLDVFIYFTCGILTLLLNGFLNRKFYQ